MWAISRIAPSGTQRSGVLHQMQRRQRHRLLARIARDVRHDLLSQVVAQYAHRSSSAAMMFKLPQHRHDVADI